MDKKNILHLIIGLGKGGAETMLYNLLKHRQDNDCEHCVVSLLGDGFYGEKIRELGVTVISLDIRKNPIRTLYRCAYEISRTNVLSTWMYHANFLGFFIAKILGCKKILWNVRHSNLNPKLNKRLTLFICRACALLSRFVSAIAYNGAESRRVHEVIGYDKSKSVVLDNGCDTSIYKKYDNGKRYLLSVLGLRRYECPIVLSVAKWSAQKDVPNLLRALGLLKRQNFPVKAVFCGDGLDDANSGFLSSLCDNGLVLGEDVWGLGLRDDIPQIMSGCDLFVLHSAGEAFPNVLIQAMACECVCVSTDAGDARRILARGNRVVSTCDSEGLAQRIKEALQSENREQEGGKNRERVERDFSINTVVATYEKIWRSI